MTEELKDFIILKTNNKIPIEFTIDTEDMERIQKHTWRKYPSSRYVQAWINGQTTCISRFLLNAPKGTSVDHINGDRMDNRKENLRLCNQAQNMKNRRPNKDGKSQYKGIVVQENGKFRAKIGDKNKRYYLGVYETEHDAVIAYNAASKVLHGEFSYMNEIPEYPTPVPSLDGLYEAAHAVLAAQYPEIARSGGQIDFVDFGEIQSIVAKAVERWLGISRPDPSAADFAGPDYMG